MAMLEAMALPLQRTKCTFDFYFYLAIFNAKPHMYTSILIVFFAVTTKTDK